MSAPNLDLTVSQNGARAVADAEADVRKAAQKMAAALEDLKRAIGYAELQRAMEGGQAALPFPPASDAPRIVP